MPSTFLIPLLLLCSSGVGLPAGVLRLCGVFLYSSGEKSGDPAAHGLLTEPNHTQHDCGNWYFYYVLSESHQSISWQICACSRPGIGFRDSRCICVCIHVWKTTDKTHAHTHFHSWVREGVLEIFHPVLLAHMSPCSQIKRPRLPMVDKQPGIDLRCGKQCKYNSRLETGLSLATAHQGDEHIDDIIYYLIMESSSSMQTLMCGCCRTVGQRFILAPRGGFFPDSLQPRQAKRVHRRVIDPRRGRANVLLTLTNRPL